jgi:hypothetical protein
MKKQDQQTLGLIALGFALCLWVEAIIDIINYLFK